MAEEEKEEKKKKSGGNMVLIIIIALLILLLAGGGLAAFLLLGSDEPVPTQATSQGTTPSTQTQARSTNMLSIGPVYPMEQFIVNLLSESGGRYLKVTLDIELDNDKLASEIDTKHSLVRDIIIRTLSAKTYEEISTLKGKDRLKDEVVSKLNEVLADGRVRNIFFTDFVVQ